MGIEPKTTLFHKAFVEGEVPGLTSQNTIPGIDDVKSCTKLITVKVLRVYAVLALNLQPRKGIYTWAILYNKFWVVYHWIKIFENEEAFEFICLPGTFIIFQLRGKKFV